MNDNLTEFAGKKVADWDDAKGIQNPEQITYRISVEFDSDTKWLDRFAAFLEDANAAQVTGIIVGTWGDVATGETPAVVVEALTAARDALPNLTALFLGDITFEESEISWIVQSDVSPLFAAYPRLEQFRVRGGQGLRFGALQHAHLKSLIVETGGLPGVALREIMAANLPALEHLELWLGTEEYGWDGAVADLAPLFDGSLFPNLRYLGLRNSQISDEIAVALVNAPIMQRIRVLDLSMGTLTDAGAAALLTSPYIKNLDKLDIHHHYLSEEMVSRFTGVPAPGAAAQPPLAEIDSHLVHSPGLGIEVDGSERLDDDPEDRYVAVGE